MRIEKPKIDKGGIPLCDYCDNYATANYQRTWIKWMIDKKGDYSDEHELNLDIEAPSEIHNVHLCKIHEKEWLNNEI